MFSPNQGRLQGLVRFAIVAGAVLSGVVVRAHAPLETWIDVAVHSNAIQLHAVMAPAAALRLIEPAAAGKRLTAEDFAQKRSGLMERGAKLFTLVQLKTRLAPVEVEVALTDDGDVDYRLTFPRPAAGLLMIQAVFLQALGDGFGGMIDVHDPSGCRLGWDQLTHDNATLVVMLPTPGLPTKKN
jgi:hypothetical protein